MRLSAGALLTLGLWPGRLRAAEKHSGTFRFLVVNDTHAMSPDCGHWLEKVVRQMQAHPGVEFCLLAGDLTEYGEREHMAAVRDIFGALGVPVYVQIGNHDYLTPTNRLAYEELFPDRLNYWFRHRDWQFVGLDTTEGQAYEKTSIQPATFRWLDENLSRMDPERPTVIFTHFPLGPKVKMRPANADDLLERFKAFNLQRVYCGHFHGFTERQRPPTTFYTNRCCALKRDNHDGSKEKGYFLCTVADGSVGTAFVEVKTGLTGSAPGAEAPAPRS